VVTSGLPSLAFGAITSLKECRIFFWVQRWLNPAPQSDFSSSPKLRAISPFLLGLSVLVGLKTGSGVSVLSASGLTFSHSASIIFSILFAPRT